MCDSECSIAVPAGSQCAQPSDPGRRAARVGPGYAALRPLGAAATLRRVVRGGAHARIGKAHDLLRRLLELVERGAGGGDRRLHRVDRDFRTGRGRLAGLLDPRREALGVAGQRFFGERRELRLRGRRRARRGCANSRRRFAHPFRRTWSAARSDSCTSLTAATADAPSTPCANASLVALRLSFITFSAFSSAMAANLVAWATLALLNSANCEALYMVCPFVWS